MNDLQNLVAVEIAQRKMEPNRYCPYCLQETEFAEDEAFHFDIDITNHLIPCPRNSFGYDIETISLARRESLDHAVTNFILNLILNENQEKNK